MSSDEQPQRHLHDQFGPAAIPLYYLVPLYRLWQNNATQHLTSAIGTCVVLYGLYNLGEALWGLIRPSSLPKYCHAEKGSWALVTGGNDGIGRAFVDELLESGFNVLIHGRNQQKLEKVKAELVSRFPKRSIEYVVADASAYDHPERKVVEAVKKLPGNLTILINNVGGVNTKPMTCAFDDMTSEDIDTQINMNDRFPTHLTSLLLPELKKNKPALILNAGSAAGHYGVPYLTTYSGTKGFIFSLSKALASEMTAEGYDKDVEVMSLMINNTLSAGNKAQMPLFTIDAKDCAKGALDRVGCGRLTIYTNWRHALQGTVMDMMPASFVKSTLATEMKKRKVGDEKTTKGQ